MHKQLKKIFIRESPAEIDWVLCSICLLMDKIAETIEDVYRQFIVHYAKYSKYTKLMDHQDYREIMQELQQNLRRSTRVSKKKAILTYDELGGEPKLR